MTWRKPSNAHGSKLHPQKMKHAQGELKVRYAVVFFPAIALPAVLLAGPGFETGFFGAATSLAGAFFVAAGFVVATFFAATFFVTTFFGVTLALVVLLELFQVKRAFFARATTLAMSSSVYTPLTPDMAESFMPCLMPSL